MVLNISIPLLNTSQRISITAALNNIPDPVVEIYLIIEIIQFSQPEIVTILIRVVYLGYKNRRRKFPFNV